MMYVECDKCDKKQKIESCVQPDGWTTIGDDEWEICKSCTKDYLKYRKKFFEVKKVSLLKELWEHGSC